MRIKYVIVVLTDRNRNVLDLLARQKLVSISYYKGAVIIARYGVNKASLMRIIRKEIV